MANFLISPKDIYSAIDDNGNPLTGGQLFTYIAGSSTPADTYTNASGNTKNDNPIILDSRGEAPVWLDDTMVYKFVLRYPASEGGAIIRTTDNITANNGGGGAGISFVTHADSDTITLDGLGTAGSPLTANAIISSITSNALGITTSGGGGMYVADLSEAIADVDNTSSNSGTGAGLAQPKVGKDLPFKSIIAGANVSIDENVDDITINSTGTTAGIITKVYFTADLDSVNTSWYQLSDTGKGTAPSAEQQVVIGANTSADFTEKYISGEYGFIGDISAGYYDMQLVVEVDTNNGNQRFEADFDLVDADGISNKINLATLDSGVLDIQANNPTQVRLTGNLPSSVTHSATQRVRVTVTAYKVGGNNNSTFSVWSGADYESYIEVPISITTDAVTDLSSVNTGGVLTQSLNMLDANKLDKVDATAQSVVSEVTFNGQINIEGNNDIKIENSTDSSFSFANNNNQDQRKGGMDTNWGGGYQGESTIIDWYSGMQSNGTTLGTFLRLRSSQFVLGWGGTTIGSTSAPTNIWGDGDGIRFNANNYVFGNVPTNTPVKSFGRDSNGNMVEFDVPGGGSTPNLQDVTDEGETTTNGATFGGTVSTKFRLQNYRGNGDNKRFTVKYDSADSLPSLYSWDEDTTALIGLYVGGFNDSNYNMKIDTSRNVEFGGRIIQGGVTDDGNTGVQCESLKSIGSLGDIIIGKSPSTDQETGNAIKYTRDGANYLTYGVGGLSGSLRIGATDSLNNALFTRDLQTRFFGSVTVDDIPTGTQVGLVGYDANGKLIQGSTSGRGLKYYPTFNVANITAGSALSGSYFAVKFIPTADIAVTKFEYYVTSVSSGKTVYCGVYNEAGNTLLGESSGNSDSIGLTETTAITAVNLTGGEVYWISILEGSGAPNFGTKTQFADSNLARSAFASVTPAGMPANITSGTATTTSAYIGVKA